MDMREKIIDAARGLFKQYGIKSVSMDDICKELGMSKKTLYNYFDQKDDLIEAVLEKVREGVQADFERMMASDCSVWDLLDRLPVLLERMPDVRKVPPLFYDLNKYYPQLAKRHNAVVYNQNVAMCMQLIRKGIDERMVRNDLDVEVAAHFLSRLFSEAQADIASPPDYGISLKRILDQVTDFVLRAILSKKGMVKYEEIKRNNEKDSVITD